MADWATNLDVEAALLRPLSPAESQTYVPALIVRAEAMLRAAVPGLDDRVSAHLMGEPGGLDPVIVAGVIADAVARALRNPEGVSSRGETTGPFGATLAFKDGDRIAAGLYFTPAELGPLMPASSGVRARTIRTPLGMFGATPGRFS